MAQCPHRDKCPFPEMRPPSTDGLFRFDMRAKRRQFNQTSAAPTWGPQVNAPSPAGPLSPGETAYRTLDAHHDIRPQLEMGIVCGGLVAVVGLCGYIGVTVPASVPVVVFVGLIDTVATAVFVRLNWDVIVLGKTDRLVIRRRAVETVADTTKAPIRVKAELREGKRTLYDEFTISNYAAWHRFCKSVQFRNKRFSGAQSKRDKVPIGDWDTITRIWVGRGWLLPFTAGETPTLTARGRAWVRAYATTPPPADDAKTG